MLILKGSGASHPAKEALGVKRTGVPVPGAAQILRRRVER